MLIFSFVVPAKEDEIPLFLFAFFLSWVSVDLAALYKRNGANLWLFLIPGNIDKYIMKSRLIHSIDGLAQIRFLAAGQAVDAFAVDILPG